MALSESELAEAAAEERIDLRPVADQAPKAEMPTPETKPVTNSPREFTPEEEKARHEAEERRLKKAAESQAYKSRKPAIPGFSSTAEILKPTISVAKAHEAAKQAAAKVPEDAQATPVVDGSKLNCEHFPWFPMEMSDFTRTEWITAKPAARALIISFKAAYWLNECRGLPSQPVAMARHIGLNWSLIKSNLAALMACHEIEVDESSGESILRDKSLDGKWKHAAKASEERRKAANKRHANARANADGAKDANAP